VASLLTYRRQDDESTDQTEGKGRGQQHPQAAARLHPPHGAPPSSLLAVFAGVGVF